MEEYIDTVLCDVANAINLSDWRYTKEEFESIGQNYFGFLKPVVMFGKINKKDRLFKLVLKLAPNDERFRVTGALTTFFLKEIFVYSVLLKKYAEIQEKFSAPLHYVIPNCYYVRKEYCKEVLVLNDMTSDGYRPYLNSFLDLDHISVALESLAKFHGLSFILKYQYPTAYDEVSSTCLPLSEKNNKRFMDILKDRLKKALVKFNGTEYVDLLEKLDKSCNGLIEDVFESVKETCVCHGDIWKENLLFKYENMQPVSACIIDYQTARISSPAFDVLYLITSSTSSELRQHHFYDLLNNYYQKLHQILNEVDLKTEEVYSRDKFNFDLKIVGPACFVVANTALWLANGLQEEGHVRSKIILTTDKEKSVAVDRYKLIIKNIIDDFNSYGYFINIT